MKNIISVSLIIATLFLSGCYTKRQYFKPENIVATINNSGSIPENIGIVTIKGATLNNGMLITKSGFEPNVNIGSGNFYLNKTGDNYIVSDLDGNLSIQDKQGNKIYTHKFPTAIVSASVDNKFLAAVSAMNVLYIIDMSSDTTILDYKSSTVYAQDSRAANPYFLTNLVVFPTLDGKIVIVQKIDGKIIKSVAISNQTFFNNIIFLKVVGDRMFAATPTKLLMISPEKTLQYSTEIKNILVSDDTVFIFKKDGTILAQDFDLITKKEISFPFAIFSDVFMRHNYIYSVEKTGYLIKIDLKLQTPTIYKLDGNLDTKSFVAKDKVFYSDKFFDVR